MRSLTRSLFIVALLLASTLFMPASAELQQISPHVYAYVNITHANPSNSLGVNTGLVVGKDAALVIETMISAKEASRFLADIRKVTDKPIRYAIDTHYHLDHAWGNCEFAKQGAIIVGQANAWLNTERAQYGLAHCAEFGLTEADVEGTTITPPSITFTDRMSLDLGEVTVDLSYLGPTHTNDSLIARIPQDNVTFTGDLLFTQYHPFIGEGDLVNWVQQLDKLAAATPNDLFIPGHGPASKVDDLQALSLYIKTFDTQAKTLCAGKKASDLPGIVEALKKALPEQGRTELPSLIEANLQALYFPKP